MINAVIPIIFYFVILLMILSKGKKKKAQRSSYSRKTTYNVKTDYNKKKSAPSQHIRNYAATNSGEYDEVSLDYCESTITPSRGITFHNMKPGTDELEILQKRNAARERELEKALHSEHSHE